MKHFLKVITNNLSLKIISLLFAITIWLFAGMSLVKNTTTDKTEAVLIRTYVERNVQDGLVSVSEPKQVSVEVRVPSSMKDILDQVEVVLDLSGYKEGEHSLIPEVICPDYVEVVRMRPARFVVELESVVTKNYTVEYGLTGNLNETGNYNVQAFLEEVTLLGLKSALDKVDKVLAVASLSQFKSNVATCVPVAVDASGNKVDGIKIVPNAVTLSLVEKDTLAKLVIVDYDIHENDTMDGYIIKRVLLTPSNVTITGEKDLIDTIDKIKLQSFEIVPSLGTNTYYTTLDIPLGVTVLDASNIKVEVTMEQE